MWVYRTTEKPRINIIKFQLGQEGYLTHQKKVEK